MIKKNGLNVIISHDTTKPLPKAKVIGSPHTHLWRVRQAMMMQIEEMSNHPKWLKYIDSQNGKSPNNGIIDEGVGQKH